MAERTVLFVGLTEEQLASVPLPVGVEAASVSTISEAVDRISLAPSDLIVANDRIGQTDSLELFGRITEADAESSTPVIFLASPGSGVQPFLYQRRRVGFEVRYFDNEGSLSTFFVKEPITEKAFTVKPIRTDLLGEEIARFLSEDGLDYSETEGAPEGQIWEVGHNQDVVVKGDKYHIQTEIVSTQPVVAATTVFAAGKAIHSERHTIKGGDGSLEVIRRRVESVHASMIGRVNAGEVKP